MSNLQSCSYYHKSKSENVSNLRRSFSFTEQFDTHKSFTSERMLNIQRSSSFTEVKMTGNDASWRPPSVAIPTNYLEASIRCEIENGLSDDSEEDDARPDDDDMKAVIIEKITSKATELNKRQYLCVSVPTVLAKNSSLYEPRRVSIGPLHRGLPHLQYQEDKKLCQLEFMFSGDINKILLKCMRRIKDRDNRISLKGFYERNVNLSQYDFIQVLLLDSLWVIRTLFLEAPLQTPENMFIPSYFLDLLLAENQIPFSIIQEIWDVVKEKINKKYYLESRDFATLLRRTPFWREGVSSEALKFDGIDHLLDLYYKWNVSITKRVSKRRSGPSLLGSRMRALIQARDKGRMSSIPSATELYEAGLKFKAKDRSANIFDISFENGILEIPPLTIDSTNISLITNLLHHELKKTFVDKYVASYVFFMDSLINTKKDVTLLKKFDIFNNKLVSDDAAASFINSLGECCEITKFNASNNFYAPVVEDILDHCTSNWRRDLTSLKHTYFSNPWTGISVVAGSSLIFLTFLQTVYTIYPYFHPN